MTEFTLSKMNLARAWSLVPVMMEGRRLNAWSALAAAALEINNGPHHIERPRTVEIASYTEQPDGSADFKLNVG